MKPPRPRAHSGSYDETGVANPATGTPSLSVGDAAQPLWIGPERRPDDSVSEVAMEWKGGQGTSVLTGRATASNMKAGGSAVSARSPFVPSRSPTLVQNSGPPLTLNPAARNSGSAAPASVLPAQVPQYAPGGAAPQQPVDHSHYGSRGRYEGAYYGYGHESAMPQQLPDRDDMQRGAPDAAGGGYGGYGGYEQQQHLYRGDDPPVGSYGSQFPTYAYGSDYDFSPHEGAPPRGPEDPYTDGGYSYHHDEDLNYHPQMSGDSYALNNPHVMAHLGFSVPPPEQPQHQQPNMFYYNDQAAGAPAGQPSGAPPLGAPSEHVGAGVVPLPPGEQLYGGVPLQMQPSNPYSYNLQHPSVTNHDTAQQNQRSALLSSLLAGPKEQERMPNPNPQQSKMIAQRFLTSQATWLQKRRHRQELRNAEAEAQMLQECPFEPNADRKKAHGGSSSSSSSRKFLAQQLRQQQREVEQFVTESARGRAREELNSLRIANSSGPVNLMGHAAAMETSIGAHSGNSYIEARKAEAAAAREEQEKRQLAECTFQPNISRSQKSYRCYRPLPFEEATNNGAARGSLSSFRPRSRRSSAPGLEGGFSRALLQPNIDDLLPTDRGEGSTLENLREHEGDDRSEDCSGYSSSSQVYSDRTRHGALAPKYSFRPKINTIPEDMRAARAYVNENVFKRLSQPLDLDSTAVGAEGGADSKNSTAARYGSYGLGRSGVEQEEEESALAAKAAAEREKAETYRNFLLRQNERQFEREEHLEFLDQKYFPRKHTPVLNRRSRRLAERSAKRSSYLDGTAAEVDSATVVIVNGKRVQKRGGGNKFSSNLSSICGGDHVDQDLLDADQHHVRRTCYGDLADVPLGRMTMGRSLGFNALQKRLEQGEQAVGVGNSFAAGLQADSRGPPNRTHGLSLLEQEQQRLRPNVFSGILEGDLMDRARRNEPLLGAASNAAPNAQLAGGASLSKKSRTWHDEQPCLRSPSKLLLAADGVSRNVTGEGLLVGNRNNDLPASASTAAAAAASSPGLGGAGGGAMLNGNVTFQPSINPKSQILPKKSLHELSQGEIDRKEEKRKLARAQMARNEADKVKTEKAAIEFTNKKSKQYSHVEPRTQAYRSYYIEELKKKEKEREEKKGKIHEARLAQELAECFFQPKLEKTAKYNENVNSIKMQGAAGAGTSGGIGLGDGLRRTESTSNAGGTATETEGGEQQQHAVTRAGKPPPPIESVL